MFHWTSGQAPVSTSPSAASFWRFRERERERGLERIRDARPQNVSDPYGNNCIFGVRCRMAVNDAGPTSAIKTSERRCSRKRWPHIDRGNGRRVDRLVRTRRWISRRVARASKPHHHHQGNLCFHITGRLMFAKAREASDGLFFFIFIFQLSSFQMGR